MKQIKYIIPLVLLVMVVFSPLKGFAAERWVHLVLKDGYEKETGFTATEAYPSKAICEEIYKGMHSDYKNANTDAKGCYVAKDVKVTSFTPLEGNIGDTITLTGSNLINIVRATIGGVETDVLTSQGSTATLKVSAGVTSGKIQITTGLHGQVIAIKDFTLTGNEQILWWFNNAQRQQKGPYDSEAECKAAAASFATNNGTTTVPSCSAKTKAQSDADAATDIKPGEDIKKDNGEYNLLAPIGSLKSFNTKNIGKYFNMIFMLAIGFCAALAVIMIIISSIQYMGDESIFGKTEAKSKIFSAILGLLIALGAYAILNTISPELTGNGGISIEKANIQVISLPDAGDDIIDPGYAKGDWRYGTDAAISAGTTSALAKLQNGWELNSFRIYTNKRMIISLKKGSEVDNSNLIDIETGLNNFSEKNQGHSGDNKTPKGTWEILEVRTSGGGKPVYSKKGSNMGASFWLLSPTTNGDRGIGMHGNKNGTLSATNGCIRLKNSDIIALLPYVKKGIPVIIE